MGKCFAKGREYTVKSDRTITMEASLIDATVINDLNQSHIIGSWWRYFEITENQNTEQ